MASINNERTTEELITEALRLDSEDHPYWDIVSVLHHSPTTDTLLQARQLCFSQLPSERELGVNVLAQLGSGNDAFHEERLQTLLSLLDTEEESRVLSAITFALGHLHDERVVLPLPIE